MKELLLLVTVSCALIVTTAVAQQRPPPGLFGPPVTASTNITAANMTNPVPLIPSDLYRMNISVDHRQAAKFAWLEFIALVAPNRAGSRGVPGGSFSNSGQGGMNSTYPLVWETYQHRSELFPYNANPPANGATPPQPWDSTPRYVFRHPVDTNDVNLTLYNNLDESNQIGQNDLFFPCPLDAECASAPGGTKPAQVLFEAKGNQLEWQYVNDHQPVDSGVPLVLPTHTIEVKAAWRPIESIPADQQYRYHVSDAIFYTGDHDKPTANNGKFALIALHIIHKTANYPSFIFATFEQVDQLEHRVTNQPTNVYYKALYSNDTVNSYGFRISDSGYSASGRPTTDNFVATINPRRIFSMARPFSWPNGIRTAFTPAPETSADSIKVIQPNTTNSEVRNVNAQVLGLMEANFGPQFVWKYYELKGVQAIPTSNETTKDYYLANIVVESSQAGIQLFRGQLTKFEPVPNIRNGFNMRDAAQGNQPFSMGGCMGCHGVAQTNTTNGFLQSDFSFLFLARNGHGVSADTAEPMTEESARAKRATYMRN